MSQMRDLTDQQLDDQWTAAIAASDEIQANRCEAEYTHRQMRRSSPSSPLVQDLEKRLAERAGKPMSRPTRPVDYGNKSEPGETG
jgi:hypothetical protein